MPHDDSLGHLEKDTEDGRVIDEIVFDNAAGTVAVKPDGMPIPEAISRAAELLEETVARHADAITALARQSPITEN